MVAKWCKRNHVKSHKVVDVTIDVYHIVLYVTYINYLSKNPL